MSYGMAGTRGSRGATGSLYGQGATGASAKEKVPRGYRTGQLQSFTPEQQQLFQQLFSNVGPDSFLSRLAGGEQGAFDEMEAPALRQFSGLQGNIASRFSGMGDIGGRHGSGFKNTITQRASDFAQDLQAQRQALRHQALQDLLGMSHELLGQRPQEKFLVQKQQRGSGWGGVAGAALGGVAGGLFGGPGGALMGAQAGYGIGNSFGGGGGGSMNVNSGGLPMSWGSRGSVSDRLSGINNQVFGGVYG